ncbi:NXPE family member 4-like isoform X2 [Antedon mediterranea]
MFSKSNCFFTLTGTCCFMLILIWKVPVYGPTSTAYNRPKFRDKSISVSSTEKTVTEALKSRNQTVTEALISKNQTHKPETQNNYEGMIDVKNTVYRLKNPDIPVKVGDFFSLIIQTRDRFGRNCTRGGDFFYTTINSKTKTKSNNAAGKITDFKNGTYEVLFFAGWPGVIGISIILVHPSEAVDFIEEIIWPMEKRIRWKGFFQRKRAEVTDCSFSKTTLLNKCNYSHPLALGETAFYCDKPNVSSCDSLSWLKSDGSHVIGLFSKIYSSYQLPFMNVAYARLLGGIQLLKISQEGNSTFMRNLTLPECKKDLSRPLNDGFWTNNVWTSLQCQTKQWTKQEIIKCMKGRHMVLMGDSTTRQWVEYLLPMLNIDKSKNTSRPNTKHIRHHSDILTLDYYFHPYAIGRRIQVYRDGAWEYEVLDNLNSSTCNYVIVVSPWAHYTQWKKESLFVRLHLLRETLIRFMKRCPNSQVLMKTPHPRRHKDKLSLMYSSDRLLYDIYEQYYSMFWGLGIHMIDIWDMNQSYPKGNVIHMPGPVIYQELFLMFSHICKV